MRLGRSPRPSDGPDGEDHGAFDGVSQLAEVARPGVRGAGPRAASAENPSILLPSLSGEEGQQMLGQLQAGRIAARSGGSASSTTFRRKSRSSRNWPAATASSRSRLDAAIKRTSAVRVPGLTDPLVAPFLEESQQLGLERQRKVADLVEEQSPAFGRGDLALGVGDGSRERAAGVAEEVALEQLGVQARAAHRDKRPRGPAAPGVDRPGQDPFAGAALAANQDHGVGRGDLMSLLEDALELRVVAFERRPRVPR